MTEYAAHRTLRGALQRGRGIAVLRLRDRPDQAHLVTGAAARDTRWDSQVEERSVYVAGLLRDLRLDPPELPGGEQFGYTLEILVALGRADERVRDTLRAHVRDGPRWVEVVESLAESWPETWWDDLAEVAAARLPTVDEQPWTTGQPWRRWHARLGLPAPAARSTPADIPAPELAALLRRAGTDRARLASVLLWISRTRTPVPEVLDLVERLAPVRPPGLLGALRLLGAQVVPKARAWAADPDHPLVAEAPDLLAAYGDDQDIPVLVRDFEALTGTWCGYETVAEGLARILAGSPGHAATRTMLVRRLRELNAASPHSYARAGHLRSLLLLDPGRTRAELPPFLHDCESEVRLLAIRETPLTGAARQSLAGLRDDPIEDQPVRDAAGARLAAG